MSNETKYTPGPWRMVSRIPGSNQTVGVVSGDVLVCKLSNRSREQSMRDACLIAAAPELYEALDSLVRYDATYAYDGTVTLPVADHITDATRVVERARAALAKARGEQ